jgi:hypothetical protein
MTMPQERTRALRWGWEFLVELRASEALTPEQRAAVDALLLHYPSRAEIRRWATEAATLGGMFGSMLEPEDAPNDEASVPDTIPRKPVSAIDRAAAIIEAEHFFKTLRGAELPAQLKRQIPYVLRHFPDAFEIQHMELIEQDAQLPAEFNEKIWLQTRAVEPFMTMAHYAKLEFRPWNDSWMDLPSDGPHRRHYNLFQRYKHNFGFCVPTREVMDTLAAILHEQCGPEVRVLDAGSGSGFISKELCRMGVSSFAVDSVAHEIPKEGRDGYPIIKVYQRDALGDAVAHVGNGYQAVLMTWPPYDFPFAVRVATAMQPGQMLIFEGELEGCSFEEQFLNLVRDPSIFEERQDLSNRLDAHHTSFAGHCDHWHVWIRKSPQVTQL